MKIQIVEDSEQKRTILEKCDKDFPRPLTNREEYEDIFSKIDKYAVFLAAYDGEEAVGYAAIYINDAATNTGYISALCLMKEEQGQHIGSALMRSCLELAAEKGMTCIRLEVLNTNAKAIRFYEHWGFEYEKICSGESAYYVKKL